jgi:hypothetical protein
MTRRLRPGATQRCACRTVTCGEPLKAPKNKSFFASFFSKKEDSSFSEEKEAKRL